MKFAENKLYIEDYVKCCNCGILIYEQQQAQIVTKGRDIYCSDWCVDWAMKRDAADSPAA